MPSSSSDALRGGAAPASYGTMAVDVGASPATEEQTDIDDLSVLGTMRNVLRFSSCGIIGACCYSLSTAVTLAAVGRCLGSYALVAYGAATTLNFLVYLPPLIGTDHALSTRCSRSMVRDPSGARNAICYLRGLMVTLPMTLLLSLFTAYVFAPVAMPFFWPAENGEVSAAPSPYFPKEPSHRKHVHLLTYPPPPAPDADMDAIRFAPYEAVYAAETHDMRMVDQVIYCLRWMIPGNVLSAIAWTTEYAVLSDPEISLACNVAALVATSIAAAFAAPHGLWAACLLPCVTFTTMSIVLFVGMAWRRPRWAAVVFTLGGAASDGGDASSLPRVWHVSSLKNFLKFAWHCTLAQLGAFWMTDLVTLVVAPHLKHVDFAAFNIATNVMFVAWTVDEGFTEGMSTALCIAAGKGRVEAALRILHVAGTMTVASMVLLCSVFVFAPEWVASQYTAEPAIIARFASIGVLVALTRIADSVGQVWSRCLEALEHAHIPAFASGITLPFLVAAGYVAVVWRKGGVEWLIGLWAAVLTVQAVYAVWMLATWDWAAAVEHARTVADTEADDDDDDDDDGDAKTVTVGEA